MTILKPIPRAPARTPKIQDRMSLTGVAPEDAGPVALRSAQPFPMPPAPVAPRPLSVAAPQAAPMPSAKPMLPPAFNYGGAQAPGAGGIDVNSYTGSMYGHHGAPPTAVPTPGYQSPRATAEQSSDRILRSQFGPPPNERGQVDVARGGVLKPAVRPTMAETVAAANTDGMQAPPASDAVPFPTERRSVPAPVDAPPSIARPVPAPVAPAQQTEAANPLAGTSTTQPGGTTSAINPGAALGVSRRGAMIPAGTDAAPVQTGGNVGGGGLYARNFNSPSAAGLYGRFVRKLFPEGQV